jgi:hypothetical protein
MWRAGQLWRAHLQGIMEAITKTDVRMKRSGVGRIALLIAVGAILAGCDRCGNFTLLQGQADIEVCRQQAPPPQ